MTDSEQQARRVALSDGPLEYTLRRSPQSRRLRVVVDPDRGVLVTIPQRESIRHAEEFLRSHERWLRRHLATQARQQTRLASRRPFGPDGRILFRGRLHHLRVESAGRGVRRSRVVEVAAVSGDELVLLLAPNERRAPSAILEAWFREQAVAAIDLEISLHASAMGVKPVGVTVRDQKTRWGSASRKGRLSFSWRLVLAPPEALETVVVHELAHLRVFGHGAAFWAIVESRRPDHRTWRRWLRDHSVELHATLDATDRATEPRQLTLEDVLAGA
jgi:predicted metal-dependent hydrolase